MAVRTPLAATRKRLRGLAAALLASSLLAACSVGGALDNLWGGPELVDPQLSEDPVEAQAQFAASVLSLCAIHVKENPDLSNFDDETIRDSLVGDLGDGSRAYAFQKDGEGSVGLMYVEARSCVLFARGARADVAFDTLAALLTPLDGVAGAQSNDDGERGGVLPGLDDQPYVWTVKPIRLQPGKIFGDGGPGLRLTLVRQPKE